MVDLSQYRKKKQQKADDSGQSNDGHRSFEEKLKNLGSAIPVAPTAGYCKNYKLSGLIS